MKKLLIALYFILFSNMIFSQSILGKWKTIDDESGKAKSVIEIFEKNNKIYGKVVEIIEVERRNGKCVKCPGEDKNMPILGMIIIKGLTKDGDAFNGGKILDPQTGKLYKCTIELDGKDKLNVRGYIGISLIGRSQTWLRVR